MKLIDLLVQELPRRGGWPAGSEIVSQSKDGKLFGFNRTSGWSGDCLPGTEIIADDRGVSFVEIEQYEAALAASKPQWDGDGFPPVGCFVEFTFGPHSKERGEFSGNLPLEGQVVEVVSKKVTSDGNDVAVVYWDDDGAGRSACFVDSCFKPIRSEADKKRDEAGLAFYHAINWSDEGELVSTARMEDYKKAYDAIAAGKIPGVKLEG